MRHWRPTGKRWTRLGESSQTALTGLAHVGLAQVLYERNELTAALDHATRGVTLCRQLAFTPPLATGLAVVARIRQAQGDAAGALEAMGEAGQAGLSPQVIALLNPVPSQRARLLLAQGDVPAAAQWTTAAGLSPDDEPDYPREPEYLVLARVLLAQNDPGPALTLLRAAARRRGQPGPDRQHHRDPGAAGARAGRPRRSRQRPRRAGRGAHARLPARLRPGLRRRGRADARPARPAGRCPPGRQQRAARRIDPGYLAALLRACGQADAMPRRSGEPSPRRRA